MDGVPECVSGWLSPCTRARVRVPDLSCDGITVCFHSKLVRAEGRSTRTQHSQIANDLFRHGFQPCRCPRFRCICPSRWLCSPPLFLVVKTFGKTTKAFLELAHSLVLSKHRHI